MNAASVIFLTRELNGGYLSVLFSPLSMESRIEALAQARLEAPEKAAASSKQRGVIQRLRGIRGKVGAALIALAGTGAAAKETEAATIMMQGEIIPAAEVTEQPEYALALTNDEYYYTISNADGTADARMTWFGVKSPSFTLEQYVEVGSDVLNTVMAPDQSDDGNRSEFFLTEADLPELSSLRYALDSRYTDGSPANLFRFLQNAEVRAGFGPLTGNPENIDEATAMTNGPVMRAIYSGNVELDDAWIFRSVREETHTPEPSAFGLAGAALGAGLASRRRLKRVLRERS